MTPLRFAPGRNIWLDDAPPEARDDQRRVPDLAKTGAVSDHQAVNEGPIRRDRIRIVYLACLAILAVGLGVELWPALQRRPIDVGGVFRLAVLASVTLALMLMARPRRS